MKYCQTVYISKIFFTKGEENNFWQYKDVGKSNIGDKKNKKNKKREREREKFYVVKKGKKRTCIHVP